MINAKKFLHEGVIVSQALYVTEAFAIKSAERRKVYVLNKKCLRSLVGVSQMYKMRNLEVLRHDVIVNELESRVDQKLLRDGLE